MKDTKVGTLIDATAQRDAIHMAIAPIIADADYAPGTHVGFMDDGRVGIGAEKKLGIIDPFLKRVVRENERCYIFLYPQTVTGMRHHWEHPAFEGRELTHTPTEIAASKLWLEEYVRRVCPYDNDMIDSGYVSFIRRAEEGEIFYHGTDCHGPGDVEDAWDLYHHLSIVLGRKIDQGSISVFSCSC